MATKKFWILVLSAAVSLVGLTAPPGQAAGESWQVIDVKTVGCDMYAYTLDTQFAGLDGGSYWVHTQTFSAGKVYGNEGYDAVQDNVAQEWYWGNDFSYGDLDNKGTWPLTPGNPVKAVFKLERPKGTVLSSWTMVAKSCDSATLLYNGPTAADPDEDYKVAPADKCPSLKAFTSTGCPLRDRTLTLKAKYGPKRVIGRLYASGYPSLYANQTVTIWKKRAGPDRVVATRTTNSLGQFKKKVRAGRYYATAPGLVVAAAGQVAADTSPVRRLR
jgi:hypothetical protein